MVEKTLECVAGSANVSKNQPDLRLDKPKSWLARSTFMKAEFKFEPLNLPSNQFELKPFGQEPGWIHITIHPGAQIVTPFVFEPLPMPQRVDH